MDMKYIEGKKNFTGMIPNRTQKMKHYKVHILIISTFLPI